MTDPEPERSRMPPYYVPAVDLEVRPSGLTLIVCPLAILRQWNSEMKKHAPGLRVLIYEVSMSSAYSSQDGMLNVR